MKCQGKPSASYGDFVMDQQSAAPVKRSGPGHGQPATLAFLSVVVFAWGGNYTWVKLALEDNGPWVFNALRYGCAVVLLGVVLSIRTQSTGILPLRGERLMMSVIGVLQIAVMTGATNIALTMIEASRTVLIAYSMPIWSMLLSRALLSERVTVRMAAGLLLGLTGLALLCAPWAMDWTSRSAVLGSGIALSGTVAWALASVLYKSRRWRSRRPRAGPDRSPPCQSA